jgi:CRISPR/Cas system CSM-associated protein Csm3 (group 7 of RAMP superfamily)
MRVRKRGGKVTMFRIQFETRITLMTAWHIGTGMAQGLVDRTTQRDPRGSVFIPASTIKGRLRNACEQVARLYRSPDNQLAVCEPPNPQNMCRGTRCCIVCLIFGSAYQGERLYFENASLLPELAKIYAPDDQAQPDDEAQPRPRAQPLAQTQPRTQVKLNRQRGIAEHGHLFTTEYAESSLVFRSEVNGKMPLTPLEGDPTRAYELILLAAGLRLVKDLGGNKSAGFGACDMIFANEIKVGEASVSATNLFDVLDLLQFYGTE